MDGFRFLNFSIDRQECKNDSEERNIDYEECNIDYEERDIDQEEQHNDSEESDIDREEHKKTESIEVFLLEESVSLANS